MTRRPPMPSPARRRPAFTLIEVMVVVAILAALTGLLVIGVRYLSLNAKRQQTHAILAQCQSMYTAWQAQAHQPFTPSTLAAPGDVTGPDRYSAAVWDTRDVFALMRAVAANAATMTKLPPAGVMTIPVGSVYPGTARLWDPQNPIECRPFDRVYTVDANGNQTYYQCIQHNVNETVDPVSGSRSTMLVGPPNKAFWIVAYPAVLANRSPDASVTVPLDAWGNPILFVPGGKLGQVNTSAGTPPNGVGPTDGRPYFASAGPDGNFMSGDDNMYSFEP